jgi:hypothetical protein
MPKYKSIQFAIESVQAHCQEMISDLFGDVVRAELERAATFEIKRAFEHMKWEEIVSRAVKAEIDRLGIDELEKIIEIKADSPVYNNGRWAGRADVCAALREILDPKDKHEWNLDGLIAEVKRISKLQIKRSCRETKAMEKIEPSIP